MAKGNTKKLASKPAVDPKKAKPADKTAKSVQPEQSAAPTTTLLGIISYDNEDAYEQFLNKLDVNQAVFVLMAASNYAQARGILQVAEGELVSKAIRVIKKSSAQPQPPKAPEPQKTTSK